MPNEAALRRVVRLVLESGKLTRRDPDQTCGGPGGGVPCAVCDRPITSEQVEYEVQFVHDGATLGLDNFQLHLRCFAVWELERTKFPERRRSRSTRRTPDSGIE
jgi:hypothetical protein